MRDILGRKELEAELAEYKPDFYKRSGVTGLDDLQDGIIQIVRTALAYLDRAEAAEAERDDWRALAYTLDPTDPEEFARQRKALRAKGDSAPSNNLGVMFPELKRDIDEYTEEMRNPKDDGILYKGDSK